MIPGRRGIETRPAGVELRIKVGHWEGDPVVGKDASGYLVTRVERVTRFARVGWSPGKEADVVARVVVVLFMEAGIPVDGIPFDNGKEFARHELIAQELREDVFFARPHHFWERGANENTNGLIRRIYPRQASFMAIGEEDLQRIDTFLNDRHRRLSRLLRSPLRAIMDALHTKGTRPPPPASSQRVALATGWRVQKTISGTI